MSEEAAPAAATRAAWPRVRTPTVLQMEATECGAAALAIVLAHHGRFVPLETLRADCGVSRDGSKAGNVVRAARRYGLDAKGFKKEPDELKELRPPFIVFWNMNHFLVVEGFKKRQVYLNDPASGPRVVSEKEFDEAFTGVVLVMQPGPDFQKGGAPRSLIASLRRRLVGARLALAYLVLVGLALVGPGLLVPTFGRVFVDHVLVAGQHTWLKPLLLAMALTALMRGALSWLQKRHLARLETRLAVGASAAFLWHVLRLPVEFFSQRHAGDIAARLASNDRVARLLSGDLANALLAVATAAFYAVLMALYDPVLCALGVAMAAGNLGAMRWASRRRVDESRKMLQDQGQLVATALGGLQTIETIKAIGGEADFLSRFLGFQAKVVNAGQRLGAHTHLVGLVPMLLGGFTTVAVLGLGAVRVMDGHLTMGMLVAFQSLMASFLGPVGDLVRLGRAVQTVEGDMARLDDVHQYPQDAAFAPPERPLPAATPGARLGGHVEFRGVTFGYSRLEPPLVEGFSATIRPGSRVALVGPSGSGKSTLAKIATGLYQPWSGEVLFDGLPARAIPREVRTNSVAMVDQDIALFEGSVRDNLTLWDATVPEAAVVRAAQDAAIHDDVAARTGGYDVKVEEGGRNFSGGQRQRLEIARALVGNPSVLVLDEATSALDPLLELQVSENLRRRGCTCILVAHRLSTIRDCDEIVVLERGRVVERGTHEALLEAGGAYARMIRAG